jgi:hypothetical protein
LIAVAAYMSEALRIVSIHHAVTRHPYILEGDGLLPSKVSELVFSDPETRGLVRAVFLVEKTRSNFGGTCSPAGEASVKTRARNRIIRCAPTGYMDAGS